MVSISELMIKNNVEYCNLGSIFVRVLFDFFADSLRVGMVFVADRQLAIWRSSKTQVTLNTCASI